MQVLLMLKDIITLKPAFNNCKELMEELSTNLSTSAKIMEETDSKIASQLK